MTVIFCSLLFLLWTLFWSFSSVIIYRLKKKEKWILLGRSHCPKCNNVLKALELIPIFTWLKNKWKCKYCKEKVSVIYPILELTTWTLFALIWYSLINFDFLLIWNPVEITKLIFWLFIAFITIIYVFYDILFLEINDTIMLIWIIWVLIILSIQTFVYDFNVITNFISPISYTDLWLYSVLLGFFVIWGLYLIIFQEFHEIIDILILLALISSLYLFKVNFDVDFKNIPILNWVIWALWIFIFFFIQIIISGGKWMGWWDLRIAIFIWLMLWIYLSFPWMMLTYLAWSIIWISIIVWSKIKNWKKTKFDTTIPFWPFLAIWFFATILMQDRISNLIGIYF